MSRLQSLLSAAFISEGPFKTFLQEVAAVAGQGGSGPPLSNAAPADVGTTAAAGVSGDASRADHVHDHGDLPGGTLHELVTPDPGGSPGFMSPADKAKLDGLGSISPLTHLVFVDKNYAGGGSDGSIAAPYTSIQDAINFVESVATNGVWWGILISPDDYDEDLSINGTNKQIALLGLGPWGLGTFTGSADSPVVPARNVTWTVNAGNVGGTQHALMIGQYQGPAMGLSTHASYMSTTRISGQILVVDDVASGGATKTLIVDAQVYDLAATGRSIDCTLGAAPSIGGCNLWIFNSRLATSLHAPPTLGGPGGLLQWAERCRFDGLLNLARYSRIDSCQIAAGLTITSATVDTQPSGIVNSNFAGTFTGPAGSCRLDGNSNYWFDTNGAVLAGGATKTIQDTNGIAAATSVPAWSQAFQYNTASLTVINTAGNFTTGSEFHVDGSPGRQCRGIRFVWVGGLGAQVVKVSLYRNGAAAALASVNVNVNAAGVYEGIFASPVAIPAGETFIQAAVYNAANYTRVTGLVTPSTPYIYAPGLLWRRNLNVAGDAKPINISGEAYPVEPIMV